MKLRNYIIKTLYSTHLGITNTIKNSNHLFYWPVIGTEIKHYIRSCSTSMKFIKSKVKDPIMCHEIPELPFYKISMDIAEFQHKNYIVVSDFYSR